MAAMTSADPTKALEAERAALEMVRLSHTRFQGELDQEWISGCHCNSMSAREAWLHASNPSRDRRLAGDKL